MNLQRELTGLHDQSILAINPPIHDFAFFDLWSKPIGLLYLLQQLRDQGNRVQLIDCIEEAHGEEKSYGRFKINRVEIVKPDAYQAISRKYYHFGIGEEAFKARLRAQHPDLILLTSGMTYWYPGLIWTIRHIRNVFPNTPLYLGGTYAQLCAEHASKLDVDAVQTEPYPILASHPALDLYPSLRYGVFLTSHGCPLACDYCASKLLNPTFKRRSFAEMEHDFAFQKGLGITDMSFYDDALLIDKENHFYPLCESLFSRSGLRFHTPNGLHVREIDARCAAVLQQTGFKTIRLSLEGIDPQMVQAGSGKVKLEEYAQAVSYLKEAGYEQRELETYILIGIPGQSTEAIRNSIAFVHALGAIPKLAEFSPIPGTPLFDAAAEHTPQLREEPLLQNNSVYCSYVSGLFSKDTLQELKNESRNPHLSRAILP